MSDEESDPVTSSSSEEEEDEDGKELTLEVEKKFLKTLQSLKTKDPAIYDANVKFFDTPVTKPEVNADTTSKEKSKQKKSKPFLLSDYDKLLVKSGGEIKEEPDVLPSYNEEQEAIKSNLKKALLESDDSDDEDSSLLTLKPKSKITENSDTSDEETDIKDWLSGAKSEPKNKQIEKELKPLHDIWTNPELDDGETYLRDYILNKRYLDDTNTTNNKSDSDTDQSSSDEFETKQEEFEHKYNFRFEDPDQEFIKRYPRTMEASMRRKESKRKVKREQAKKNKEDKVERKKGEMKKLRQAKREEILNHLHNLKSITGNQTLAFKDTMLEGDFNPDEHDKIMESMFNEEFYAGKDDQKPVFEDDEDYGYPEDGNAEENEEYAGDDQEDAEGQDYCEEATHEHFTENGELITDCDYDPSQAPSRPGRKLGRAKLKRLKRKEKRGAVDPAASKSLFAQAVARPKPAFNPRDETFMKYVDEYYGLEFEDVIGGDLPCRFKYKRVVPNSYGLTIEEILAVDDKELNKWCPIKKIYSQRAEHVEKNEVRVYTQRSSDEKLKRKLLPSLFKPPDEVDDEEETQRILPTEEERKEMMNKKQKRIQQISEQFEREKQAKPAEYNGEEGTPQVEKEDLIDETIVNEYLKEKKKTAKSKSIKRKLDERSQNKNAVVNVKETNSLKRKLDENKQNENTVTIENNRENKKEEFAKKKKKLNGEKASNKEKTGDKKPAGVVKKKKAKSDQAIKPENEMTNKKVAKENCDSKLIENGLANTQQKGEKKKKKRKRKKKKKKKISVGPGEEIKEEDVNEKDVNKKAKKSKKKAVQGDVGASKVVDKIKKSLKKKIKVKQEERKKLKKKYAGKGGDKVGKSKKDAKVTEFSDARLKAYGINPKKFKSKLLYGNKDKPA